MRKQTASLLFCDNETNVNRLYGARSPGYFKDAFHEYLVQGNLGAVNPLRCGTKAAVHYMLQYRRRRNEPRAASSLRMHTCVQPFTDFDDLAAARRREANGFYAELQRAQPNEDARLVQRQAFAGMIWSKQYYDYDVRTWLNGDPAQPPPPAARRHGRNSDWTHLNGADIFSMPDKWEYPWFAAWDLAFHAVTMALIDAEFAKQQLLQLGRHGRCTPTDNCRDMSGVR